MSTTDKFLDHFRNFLDSGQTIGLGADSGMAKLPMMDTPREFTTTNLEFLKDKIPLFSQYNLTFVSQLGCFDQPEHVTFERAPTFRTLTDLSEEIQRAPNYRRPYMVFEMLEKVSVVKFTRKFFDSMFLSADPETMMGKIRQHNNPHLVSTALVKLLGFTITEWITDSGESCLVFHKAGNTVWSTRDFVFPMMDAVQQRSGKSVPADNMFLIISDMLYQQVIDSSPHRVDAVGYKEAITLWGVPCFHVTASDTILTISAKGVNCPF